MVKIRLTRIGKRGEPHYRIIAIQSRTKRDGRALDYLGYYNPRTNPSTIKLNKEKIQSWLEKGAQPTDTVKHILIKEKLIKANKIKKQYKKKPGKKKQEKDEMKKDQEKAKGKDKAATEDAEIKGNKKPKEKEKS